MRYLPRTPRPPRHQIDAIGRTTGYGHLRPAVEYRHADGTLQYIIHGSKERAESNAAIIGRGRCRFVWVDPKTGLPPQEDQ